MDRNNQNQSAKETLRNSRIFWISLLTAIGVCTVKTTVEILRDSLLRRNADSGRSCGGFNFDEHDDEI